MLTASTSSTGNVGNEIELFRLPYEDDDFLTYIDNEELPMSILDLLEKAWPELFYSGCVIAEVRDQRRLPMTTTSGKKCHFSAHKRKSTIFLI